MTDTPPNFHLLPVPWTRQLTLDGARLARHRATVRGLIEVDVTLALRLIRQHKAMMGEALSLTAFLIWCLGQAVDAQKSVQASRDWRGRLVVFGDVDVSTLFEVNLDGALVPLPHVLRTVNRRTLREIHDEVRAVQRNPQLSPSMQRPARGRPFVRLPTAVRMAVYAWVSLHPQLSKAYRGTVGLTAVGMFGQGSGWGLSLPAHPLSVTVGGIREKPAIMGGQVVPRDFLCLTIDFDPAVTDGAPAARFVSRFAALIENAGALLELEHLAPA